MSQEQKPRTSDSHVVERRMNAKEIARWREITPDSEGREPPSVFWCDQCERWEVWDI